jgi:hypothetical protein
MCGVSFVSGSGTLNRGADRATADLLKGRNLHCDFVRRVEPAIKRTIHVSLQPILSQHLQLARTRTDVYFKPSSYEWTAFYSCKDTGVMVPNNI